MKKIGFIDYHIDEWHAHNFPDMIRQSAANPGASRYDVALAWEQTHFDGRMTLDDFCRRQKIGKADSLEQLIEECDVLMVLAPDNAETHEDLSELALRSRKPLYIDKPVAPTRAAAERLFEKAERHGTPMFSASSLRFGSGLRKALDETIAGKRLHTVSSRGPGVFHIYAIHQLEMIVSAMGPGARRVMQFGTANRPGLLIDYGDDRRALMHQIPWHPFQISLSYAGDDDDKSIAIDAMEDFFPRFIEALLEFFDTGKPPVPAAETLEIASLIEAGSQGLDRPFEWVTVPR